MLYWGGEGGGGVAELPTGTVTFLFTDLEGSTRLWEEHPEAMRPALARHDALLTQEVESCGGRVVKTTGDGIHAVFAVAEDAVASAIAGQVAMAAEPWGEVGDLRVRMGLHTGAAESRGGDYYGPALNRAARLMAVAHGGQVVCSQATADLVRDSLPSGAGLADLGEHRLRDVARLERVFQVTHSGLLREFALLRSLGTARSNLPLQRTGFIGRGDELSKLEKLLDRSRVITLTGAGGVGKTRLALQTAESVGARFDDGVWFVDLAPADDATMVAAAVGAAMGLPDRRQGTVEDAIVAASSEWRSLIVLDNCEHVVEAAARLTDLMMGRCSGMTVLATSREPLGVEGELILGVGPLRVPQSGDEQSFEELLDCDAVRLFVERASAVREGFSLSTDNAAVVASVCRRLDGIPLAIELAAARVQSMSPQSILERLDERFRLLSHGRRTAMARHQTLRGAVDWSYGLLQPAEQLVFGRLSVFAGGFTMEAAEAVVSGDGIDPLEVLDTLGDLVAKSMVFVDEAAASARYGLLETLREYGADRLEELDAPERLRARHTDYYVALVEEAAAHILGTDDSTWTQRLVDEHDNLHAALIWTREHDVPKLTRIARALGQFWRRQRYFREGVTWIEAALAADPDAPPMVRAELAALAGWTAVNLSLVERGQELLQASLESSAQGEEEPNPYALLGLALAALVTNRPSEARAYSERALARARAGGQPYVEAEILSQAAIFISLTSEDLSGIALADRAVEIARPLGNDYLLGLALEAAGVTRYRVDPAMAIAFLDESMIMALQVHTSIADQSLLFKGIAHLTLHDYRVAADSFDTALTRHHAAGAEYYQSMVLAAIAGLLARTGSTAPATRLLGALERLRDDGRMVGAPRDLGGQDRLRDRLQQIVDGEQFEALWRAGRALTLDDAVSLAHSELAQIEG